jgi:tetrahydromethanopterin S-methyltransferase subunit D
MNSLDEVDSFDIKSVITKFEKKYKKIIYGLICNFILSIICPIIANLVASKLSQM